jgi:hypothetical protein
MALGRRKPAAMLAVCETKVEHAWCDEPDFLDPSVAV